MNKQNCIYNEFTKRGGVLKTSELNAIGFSSRKIRKLLDDNLIRKIKYGYYEIANNTFPDEVVIARIFPQAVIFLESALLHYGYTDRIPQEWQIAVDRDSEKSQFKLNYPIIKPFYMESKFLEVGQDKIKKEGISIKIFDRDRTICDVLRYENKLEREVFNNAIQRYIKDPNKNVRRLFEYAELFKVKKKVQMYMGVWF
mgnify:FL=1